MSLHLIDIYNDLQKVAIPQYGKETIYDRIMDSLHQAALRELDYQAAMRRLASEESDAVHAAEEHNGVL